MTNCNLLILVIILIALVIYYQIFHKNTIQIGGQDIVSTNIIVEGSDADVQVADIQAESLAATENAFMGDFRNADFTDNNLSRSDVNTIANGAPYVAEEQANMYFTGDVVDGIGNYTVDGTNRVQGQQGQQGQTRRISPISLRRPLGRVIEANTWSMIDYRPRSNDRAFRIMRAGIRQLDVLQVFDSMGRTSFVLRLKGMMPTACNQLRILPVRLDPFGNIRLTAYSIVDPLLLCTRDIQAWQVDIPLIRLPLGRYTIVLNNRPVTTVIQT